MPFYQSQRVPFFSTAKMAGRRGLEGGSARHPTGGFLKIVDNCLKFSLDIADKYSILVVKEN